MTCVLPVPTANAAEPVGSVAILPALGPETLPPGALREYEKSLRASLERIPGISEVKADLKSTEHDRTDETPALKARFAEARALFDSMELGGAIEKLVALRKDAEPLFGHLTDPELVPEILFLLALAELTDGRPEAKETLADYVRIRPDARLSADDHPPKVLKAVTRAIKSLGASGVLEVESTPPGAVVAVDGLPRGKTPVTIDLPPGGHVVVLSMPRYAPSRTMVDVDEGDLAAVSVPLTADGVGRGIADMRDRVFADQTARDVSPILGRLAAELGVDAVVQPLMETIEGGYLVSALVVRPGARRFYVWAATTVDGTMRELAVSTALLATIITSGEDAGNVRARSAGGTAPPFPEMDPNGPLRRLGNPLTVATTVPKKGSRPTPKLLTRWWLWTGVGAVVVGGVIVGLAAGGVFTPAVRVEAIFPPWNP